jgi:hypothetical protein
MKYALFFSLILGVATIGSPAEAQFSSFGSGSDNCSSFCVKLDLGSANNDSSFSSNNGFNSDSNPAANNLRWQVGFTWRPSPPEVAQGEGERVKQRLEDNKAIMIALAEAISQNKTEMARGLAILLAPRLGYSDPRKLLAEMKEGSTSNFRPAIIDRKENFPNISPPSIEPPKGLGNPFPAPVETPKDSIDINPSTIELR